MGEVLFAKLEHKLRVHLRVFEDDELVTDLPHGAALRPVRRWSHRVHVLGHRAVEAECREVFCRPAGRRSGRLSEQLGLAQDDAAQQDDAAVLIARAGNVAVGVLPRLAGTVCQIDAGVKHRVGLHKLGAEAVQHDIGQARRAGAVEQVASVGLRRQPVALLQTAQPDVRFEHPVEFGRVLDRSQLVLDLGLVVAEQLPTRVVLDPGDAQRVRVKLVRDGALATIVTRVTEHLRGLLAGVAPVRVHI
mmetsp:Transcript_1503/g.3923  ORF Transcript_1503/g.3923 Transcript_1503/m.3923 type:complete len:247 (-) Transcript_1503:618-1358(-)